MGQLAELVVLDLGNNELRGSIPYQLRELSKLRVLILHDNRLTGRIPPELGQLTNLKVLSLTRNELLTGAIPGTLSKLTSLGSLSLEGTNVTKVQDGTDLVGNWGTKKYNINHAQRPHRKISRLFEEIRNQTTGLRLVSQAEPHLPVEVIRYKMLPYLEFGKIIKPYKKASVSSG